MAACDRHIRRAGIFERQPASLHLSVVAIDAVVSTVSSSKPGFEQKAAAERGCANEVRVSQSLRPKYIMMSMQMLRLFFSLA